MISHDLGWVEANQVIVRRLVEKESGDESDQGLVKTNQVMGFDRQEEDQGWTPPMGTRFPLPTLSLGRGL